MRRYARKGLTSSDKLLDRRWVAVAALVTGSIWLWTSSSVALLDTYYRVQQIQMVGEHLLHHAPTDLVTPPTESESNGYLRVRCDGSFARQRSAICNAVVIARIMNATLVLPEILDTSSSRHDESGFADIYDVPHFIKTLKYDVRIVMSLPNVITTQGKTKKLRAYKIQPPRDRDYVPVTWYKTTALDTLRKFGAIYLEESYKKPCYRKWLAEEIDDPELQRLRCRVNYHALQFKPNIKKTGHDIVNKLRSEGHFMSIHPQFELDMLAAERCFDIFTPKEQEIVWKYQEEHFPMGLLVFPPPDEPIGKCPLTPEEVDLIIRAMGFNNTTRIYLSSGEFFGGKRLVKPLKAMFPRLEGHTSVVGSGNKLEGLVGSAVDYMVCLLSDIFMPTYHGQKKFANHIMGHRLYYGFRTTIKPDREALVPIFKDMKEGHASGYKERIRQVMLKSHFGAPHKRIPPEYTFYTNSWPECFCQMKAKNHTDRCPPKNNVINNVLESQFLNKDRRSY